MLLLLVWCFSYVPALRPLRQQAFLLAFPQTQPSRLAQRLSEVQTQTNTYPFTHSQFSYIIQTLYPNLSSPDFTSPGDEDRHRRSDVTVWEDRQWHQVLYQHTAGGRQLFEKLDYPQQTFNPGSWCAPKWVFLKKLHDENYFKIENTDKTVSLLNALSLY